MSKDQDAFLAAALDCGRDGCQAGSSRVAAENGMPMNPSQVLVMRTSTFFTPFVWVCLSLFTATQNLAQDSGSQTQAKIAPLFKAARQAEQRRDFEAAVKWYDEILSSDLGIAEVWTNKGLCLYELSKHREAVNAFAKAAALKPQLLVPHLFLGIEYLKLDQPQKAVSPLQSALILEPNHPQASYELANAYVRLEQFEQAIKLYRQLLRRDSKMEEAWYRLGIAYLNWSRVAAWKLIDSPASAHGKLLLAELQAVGGLRQDAETNFRGAVAAQPDLVEARLALGQFYLDSQTPEPILAAQEQLAKAKELDPRNLRVEMALIRLDLVQKNFVGAIKRLENVLQVDLPFARKHLPELVMGFTPDLLRGIITEARAFKGEAHDGSGGALAKASGQALLCSATLELGAEEPAETALRNFDSLAETLKLSPLDASYSQRLEQLQQQANPLSVAESLDLAVAAWSLGEYDRALGSLLAVLHRAPDNQALYWLSRTCRALARETFEEALARNPGSYRAHLLLADLANQSHDTARALAEYDKAVSTGNGDPEVHLLFIQFLTAKARVPEALEKARIAVEKFPAHPALNRELGKLLLKTGNSQQAIRHFRRSLAADSNFAETRAELADAYATSGEFEKAIQEMKAALPADKDGSFHYRLGRWYQKMGQSTEADAALAMATQLKEARREAERSKLIPFEPQNSQR